MIKCLTFKILFVFLGVCLFLVTIDTSCQTFGTGNIMSQVLSLILVKFRFIDLKTVNTSVKCC